MFIKFLGNEGFLIIFADHFVNNDVNVEEGKKTGGKNKPSTRLLFK